jgi:hypothetical protein
MGLAEPIALVLEINGRLSRRLDDGLRCLVVVLVFFFHVYRDKQVLGLQWFKRSCIAIECNISAMHVFIQTTFSCIQLHESQI